MDDATRCTATSKRSGERCKRSRSPGLTHCSMHAGVGKAERERAAADASAKRRADAVLARLDVAPVTDSLSELQWLAGVARGLIESFAGLVNQLENRIRYEGHLKGEQLRAEVQLLERAIDRCASINVSIAKLGIDERITSIKERDARFIATALTEVLRDLGLDADTAQQARSGFAARMRAYAPPPDPQDPQRGLRLLTSA